MADNKMPLDRLVDILQRELDKKKKSIENLTRAVNTLISVKQELNQKNEILAEELKEVQQGLTRFQKEVEKLTAPPNAYAFVVRVVDVEKRTVDIFFDNKAGRQMVTASLAINISDLKFGTGVRLNEALNIIEIDNALPLIGSEAYFDCWIDRERLRVTETVGDERLIVFAADSLPRDLDIGDALRIYAGFAFEKLEKTEAKEYFLEETPNATFDQIGGLEQQITQIRELIEWPFLFAEEFKDFGIKPSKGILLFGPPGCGKTLLARAIANNLAQRSAEIYGLKAQSYFLNIKGPELLNKYVGNTEAAIRAVFARAKKLAGKKVPVIMFWDEFEGLFQTRGTGISTDIQNTIVPQFNTEMDGVEALENVIVIAATNRQDRIDPAVIRSGRFDNKIEIPRPDNLEKARKIFDVYFRPDNVILHPKYFNDKNYEDDYYVPRNRDGQPRIDKQQNTIKYLLKKDPALIVDYLVSKVLDRIFDKNREENKVVELIYQDGLRETICFCDLNTGASIEATANKARWTAFRRFRATGEKGIQLQDLMDAADEEYGSQEKLPNLHDLNEWAGILGKRKPIASARSLADERKKNQEEKEKKIETVQTGGHYL